MNRKVPTRKCIGCGKSGEKKDFVRIVRTKDGEISLDATGKINGRGAYICKNSECVHKAMKSKALNRAFRQSVPDSVYESLEKEMMDLE